MSLTGGGFAKGEVKLNGVSGEDFISLYSPRSSLFSIMGHLEFTHKLTTSLALAVYLQ